MFRNSCLHWAASFGSPDTISLLLARGAQVIHLQGIRDGNLWKVSSSYSMSNWFNFFLKGTIVVISSNPSYKGIIVVISSNPSFKGTIVVISSDPSFKGTFVVISSDPSFKKEKVRFTTEPLISLSYQEWLK